MYFLAENRHNFKRAPGHIFSEPGEFQNRPFSVKSPDLATLLMETIINTAAICMQEDARLIVRQLGARIIC